MESEVVRKLVDTAWELGRIQIENVKDFIGFSNADKNVGCHLAAVVEADPTDEDAVRRLAALVGVKYQRQVGSMPGMSRYLADFKALAQGTKLSPEDRLAARMTIVAQPDVHPKFGARILLSFQYNEQFAYILKDNGAKAFHGADGWKWAVPATRVTDIVSKLKAAGANIVGKLDLSDIDPAEIQDTGRVIGARLDGRYIFLTFKYDRQLVGAMRTVPRQYFEETRENRILAKHLGQVTDALQQCGDDVDVSALVALADKVTHLARPTEAQEPVIDLKGYIPSKADDLQREGTEWLVRPINEVRGSVPGGSSIRGYILGDKPGIGKTLQAAVAAKATLEAMNPSGRIVVITPGNHKIGWMREIRQWCGADETIQVLNGDSTIDASVRWIVVNYDILGAHYQALMDLGFDVLIVDEAHYAKNHDAMRSKLVVGGKQKVKIQLSEAQRKRITSQFVRDANAANVPIDKAKLKKALNPTQTIQIEGLAGAARLRVFPLTGTPLDNRPKDLFAQIRMVGHPLGRNFREFAMQYCDPQYVKKGKRIYGTNFDGKSNLGELRERLAPVFLQRHANVSGGELHRTWTPVELDLTIYRSIMAEYDAKRREKARNREVMSKNEQLAYYNEARRAAALAMVPNTIESVEQVVEADEKVIVFSYFTDVIKQIKEHFGDAAIVIDGSVTTTINKKTGTSKRQAAQDKFQSDLNVKVLIGQLTAAGVAVTLTAANYVKFNDMDWKPGTHFQCERRAYRRGQTKDVFVEYMIAAGTFYEELATMLEEKLNEQNEFEGTNEVLFERLVERLNTEAPRNEAIRKLGVTSGQRMSKSSTHTRDSGARSSAPAAIPSFGSKEEL